MQESLFVILTDAEKSSSFDKDNPFDVINWRVNFFELHLTYLKKISNSTIIKSIGDSLFIKACVNEDEEEKYCKELLKCLVLFFEDRNKTKPKIRIAVHKVDKLQKGIQIFDKLYKEDSSQTIFLNSLKEDIFGNEVNKSFRIQDIVKVPIILLTDSVVKSLGFKSDAKNIEIDNFIVHSPVPVVYLKGVIDISEEKEIEDIFYVWQLSKKEEQPPLPILKFESKSYQTFRFLNASINKITGYSDNDIYDQVNNAIFKKKGSEELLNFFVDVLFKVDDYFSFNKIDFTRPIKSLTSTSNCFDNFYFQRNSNGTNSEINIKNINIDGWFNTLTLNEVNNKINCTSTNRTNNGEKRTIIPFLTISSFRNEEIGTKIRKLYEYDNDKGIVNAVEPQTIKIHQNILFSDRENNNSGNHEKYILLFFGVYNEFIKEADEIGLFKGDLIFVRDNFPIAYGLISGVIDGFILYKTTEENYTSDIATLLTKLYSINTSGNRDFFDWVFPISIFLCSKYQAIDAHPIDFSYLKDFSNYVKEKNKNG